MSAALDVHIYPVLVQIERAGHEYALLEVGEFPLRTLVTQRFPDGDCMITLGGDGTRFPADEVTAVWYRKPDLVAVPSHLSKAEKSFAYEESIAAIHGLYDALGEARWISPVEALRASSNKLRQLRRASSLGFTVPRTIVTNDKDAALKFVREASGPIVYKSAGIGGMYSREGPWEHGQLAGAVYTTILDRATLEVGLDHLHECPALLQEYVPKDVELRVTIVGDEVFAAEIHSQDHEESRIDWRLMDPYEVEHRAHTLPDPVSSACVGLTKSFGLRFAAIDLIKTPDGQYAFLEVNPNGQFGWIENLTGLQISRAIARELMRPAEPRDRANGLPGLRIAEPAPQGSIER